MSTPAKKVAGAEPVPGALSYTGRELESMAFAVNYHRWILETLRPFVGKRLIEVGAGSGSFSELILETWPDSLTMLEPSANMYPILAARLPDIDRQRVGQAYQRTLGDTVASIPPGEGPDSIFYVNVLEHIEDDERELALAHSVLCPGGRILLFVPANRWLMGAIDHDMGHFRRYALAELTSKCTSAGFKILFSTCFDFIGMFPWWLKYCVLRSRRMEPHLVRWNDRWVVPVSRLIEGVIRPPVGKNIVLVGGK
jgi:SAM-dependent methyltransferase